MMETKTIKLKCESCGASLTAKEGKEFMYCEHCGTKIYLVAKQEIKHTYLDETEIKKAQIYAETKLKQEELNAEIEQKKEDAMIEKSKTKSSNLLTKILTVFALIILPFIINVRPLLFLTGFLAFFIVISLVFDADNSQ